MINIKKIISSFCLAAMALAASAQQMPILIHSHNDYERNVPFWQAYSQTVYSIEADVFLKDGVLLVGHDEANLSPDMTFESMYLTPAVTMFDRNGGKPYAGGQPLQLMVELKSETAPAMEALISLLSRRPDVFDPSVNPAAIRVTITGNVPAPEEFRNYPEYISFDGQMDADYTPEQLARISVISTDFGAYSIWNGKGSIIRKEAETLNALIDNVHSMGKPIRFWNAPEGTTPYYTFYDMGIDYFNTDHPETCAAFFSDFHNKNFQIGEYAEADGGVTGTKKLDKTTRNFKGFRNDDLYLDHGIEVYEPTFRNDGSRKKIKNVIFLMGDGMGLNQVTAGAYANKKSLTLLNFRNIGLIFNNALDAFTTDSAAGGSALATGEKHCNRHISMSADGEAYPSLSDWFHDMGKKVGVVTLGNAVDATPTAFYAHYTERDSADVLTAQLLDGHLDLLCGSGMEQFTVRHDGRDLISDLEKAGYNFISDSYKINDRKGKVICIDEKMGDAADQANLSLLADATNAAITKLQEDNARNGFFLFIEGAKIDYAGHSRCLPGSVIEMLSFDMAIREAVKFADRNGETLVIVTADHETGGLMIVDGDERTGRVMGIYNSDDHMPVMLPVFAYGPGSQNFNGVYQNWEIARRIRSLTRK